MRMGQHLVLQERSFQNTYLCDFAQGTTFLTEIDHYAAAAVLSLLYGLLDTEDEVRSASANIGTENITAVTLQRQRRWLCQRRKSHPTRDMTSCEFENLPRRVSSTQVSSKGLTFSQDRRSSTRSNHLKETVSSLKHHITAGIHSWWFLPIGGKKTLISERVINWQLR